MSISKKVMPCCFFALLSVRVSMNIQSDLSP
jgi:hypothetical protein